VGAFNTIQTLKVDLVEMGGQIVISTNEAPLFDGTNYSSWRENIKRYLK
jgi:hypothetical protein